jgi:hypothetical protein
VWGWGIYRSAYDEEEDLFAYYLGQLALVEDLLSDVLEVH